MVVLTEEDFGEYKGEVVKKYTWQTKSGVSVSVISFGAIIQSVLVPDKNGKISDVALGFDDLPSYVERNRYNFGSTIGRYANRIRGASFEIDGVSYQLAKNDRVHNHLHGGIVGFDKVNWNSIVDGTKVICSYLSKDGEEGYPGDVLTNVIYDVTDDGAVNIDFIAMTNKKTIVSLLDHSYFNLAGHETGEKELYNHVITINADKITETTPDELTTGRFINVGGTVYDLRVPTRLGDVMQKDEELFANNYCVRTNGKDMSFVARVVHPESGRYLEVFSDYPGVQFFTSTCLPDGQSQPAVIGKSSAKYQRYGGFCLETQNYPDAIHHKNFPNPILTPGQIYKQRVSYVFSVEK